MHLDNFQPYNRLLNGCPFNLLRKSVLVKRKKEKVYLMLHSIFTSSDIRYELEIENDQIN
jgi:hypothetical protein